MLNYSKNGDILEVIEECLFFNKTITLYWYYDMKNLTQSSCGKKGDVCDRLMSDNTLEWVKKYYIPKVS